MPDQDKSRGGTRRTRTTAEEPKEAREERTPPEREKRPEPKREETRAPARSPIPKEKPTYVRLRNKLRQRLQPSVYDDRGRALPIRLGPNATSGPVRKDRLTAYTQGLIARGHLRVG